MRTAPLWLRFAATAAVASAVGFAIHVADQTIVPPWVAHRMQGVPNAGPHTAGVIAIAAISSIEIGIALCVVYSLLRAATPDLNVVLRGALLGVIALASHGDLLRQPMMNTVIGNPISVALVMAVGPWLTSIIMAITLAVIYDWLIKAKSG